MAESAIEFKPGDVVRLKSHGPTMTVASVTGPAVRCDWFWGGKIESREFRDAQLERYTDPPAEQVIHQRQWQPPD